MSTEPKNINIDGLAVRSVGPADAPLALVFLHYWGGSSRTWEPTIKSLLSSHPDASIRFVAYDSRGWGSSTKPETDYNSYTIRGLADDCEKVVEQLSPRPARIVLVGHSMGGKVAQLVAARWRLRGASNSSSSSDASLPSKLYPDLAGLVLVAPAPPSPTNLPQENKEQLLHAYDSVESIQMVVDHVLSGNGVGHLGEDRTKIIVEDSLQGGDLARDTWVNHAMPEDIQEEVRRGLGPDSVFSGDDGENDDGLRYRHQGHLPTIIVAGDLDRVEPAEMLKEKVLPKIDGAEFVVLKGVGHLIPLEASDILARHISSIISRNHA